MTTVETLQDHARSHIQIHAKGTGGNTKFTCEHCGKQFTGSLTRQLAHLVGDSGNGIADEEFVPAYEMQDAADSDAEEMSDDE